MAKEALPDLSIALTYLRSGQGWSQAELGEAAGISPNILNDYERGRKTLTRERLEYLIAFLGLPPKAIDSTLGLLAANRASGRGPLESTGDYRAAAGRLAEALAVEFGNSAADFARSSLSLLTVGGEAIHARQAAESLWERLKKRSPAGRLSFVEHGLKFRTWALCERVAAESIRMAPNQPAQALELAGLALLIAERLPGERAWSLRLQGYAWAHVSNARRVCNDLPGAEEAIVRAWKLWEAGAPGDPGFLNAAWLPGLEATLHRDQRRFPEALKRIDEALALDPGELRGQILLSKSAIYQILGDPEGSAAALSEAAPLIDPVRRPRDAFGMRFNLLVDLCHLERFKEAESRLPEVRALAERLGEELDLTRVVWLEAKVAAGLGRSPEARGAFEQVRRVFLRRELALTYALVTLELAVLFLEQGLTAEVKALAKEMLPIFRTQGVKRETLAALQLFCEAAQRESATLEHARRLVKFLHRAQLDPELRFTEEGVKAL